jgi:hypothetical protein
MNFKIYPRGFDLVFTQVIDFEGVLYLIVEVNKM